jgi:isoleucyl-tRNA synthetase
VGTRGVAPFKAVVTDGFVMDEQGRKMSKSLGNVTAPQEVADKFGVDILRLWVMMSDTSEDLRIGQEILKQQVELYRRLRNTLRWLLGSLDGFSDEERVPYTEIPELEKSVLHRLSELDARIRASVQSYDWTGVYPELHNFCATDLSAFYFDIRKDAIYCDRPDSARRRAARTVLDHLHRCLTTWLAPVLCFTAEEAWCARFGEQDSVHLQQFADVPREWHDAALAERWETIRAIRRRITIPIEEARRANTLGSSLQAAVTLPLKPDHELLLTEDQWAEIAIVSDVRIEADPEERVARISLAPGAKCARCWRVLPEVGTLLKHEALCERCADAVDSGLVCKG